MWLDDDLAAISPKGEDEYDELTIDAAAGACARARARAFVALFRRPLNSSYNTDDSAWRTELAAELAAELADDLKNAANDALAMFTNFAESMSQATELQGKSLGILDTDHPLRVALHKFIQHPLVESFLLLLIMFNLIALAATSPGSEIDLAIISTNLNRTASAAAGGGQSGFDETMYAFNFFCACAFTAEAVVRILVLGFVRGPGTYLHSAWNAFDFVLVVAIWLSITASALLGLDDDAGFALAVLRTLRLMRFFSGIRELMSAVSLGYKMLLTIIGLLLYAWIIGGILGMELFAGAVSRKCFEPGSPAAAGLAVADCPISFRCELPLQCYELAPPPIDALHVVQVRDNHRDKIGFDTIGMSFVTEFQMTVMDDWPELLQVNSPKITVAFSQSSYISMTYRVSAANRGERDQHGPARAAAGARFRVRGVHAERQPFLGVYHALLFDSPAGEPPSPGRQETLNPAGAAGRPGNR